ncbi:MAG: hypothetical protein AABZ00_12200 [Chloroflexota bacterium]
MKTIKNMSLVELAAFIQSHLRKEGIDVVLSGGASVTLYSSSKYVSHDLDLINVGFVKRTKIRNAMAEIGFQEKGRVFENPETEYLVEFPDGPLSVGEEPVKEIMDVKLPTGVLRVVSPTDCVKDRLCAYYFWGDQQGLVQAILVVKNQKVDLKEVERWSKVEGKLLEFRSFKNKID